MARFDVYANPDKAERAFIPFFLDIQSDHIKGVATRVVVPLWIFEALEYVSDVLNPDFQVGGEHVIMETPALMAVPLSLLRRPVANLSPHQFAIQNALDILLGAY